MTEAVFSLIPYLGILYLGRVLLVDHLHTRRKRNAK